MQRRRFLPNSLSAWAKLSAVSLALLIVTGIALLPACASVAGTAVPRSAVPSAGVPSIVGNDITLGAAERNIHRLGFSATTLDSIALGSQPTAFIPGEELWIISQPDTPIAEPDAETPRTVMLLACVPVDGDDSQEVQIPVPLKHTKVEAEITGYIASVGVKQTFHNPYDAKIEAEYVFPLPHNAAVNGFVMTVGERTIRGVIRKREEAEKIYNAARAAGHTASLLTQQRPNIFTQRVANIEPGKTIDIDITYFNTLTYSDGWFSFVFPMVVGPRFNPPETITRGDAIIAKPRGKVDPRPVNTEAQYLAPNERSGHDIAMTVRLDAGVPIESLRSANHRTNVTSRHETGATVTLADGATIPNKDFVLQYKVASDEIKSGMLVTRDGTTDGGYFTLLVMPPASLTDHARTPLEMVFVLDTSGSMSGQPIAQSKHAMHAALDRLDERDTFQIVRFSDAASTLSERPLQATGANVDRGKRYVRNLSGGGGTHMMAGVEASLGSEPDPERLRVVTFLTDGYIGNEARILRATHGKLDDARVFSFGVGSAPNRYLMNRMASLGRGAAAYIGPNEQGREAMESFFDRIAYASLTDIEADFGPLQGVEFFPERIPDLYVGRPIIITGRSTSGYAAITTGNASVRLVGRAGTSEASVFAPVSIATDKTAPAMGSVWARSKIRSLSDRLIIAGPLEGAAFGAQIETVALQHSLMSAYTSFVAVDSSRVTAGDVGYTVAVPVPVPDGVRYETTIGSSVSPALDSGG
ncbi:MAG: VIT domain-containing protein [Planctomycetota bacterium]